MKGIVIATREESRQFLEELLKSIKTDYPIYICWEGLGRPMDSYELGAIKKAKELFSEFIFLQDSCIIKDNTLFDKLFEIEGNVFLTKGSYHYMGKFCSKDLHNLPGASSKAESISRELNWLPHPHKHFEPDLIVHTDVFEEKHGQRRMRLENDYIIKWKGTYSL